MEPNIVFGLCLGCFVIGLAIGYALFRGGDTTAAEKAEQVEAELTEYKSAVNEHFSQTAEHFKALGKNYRDLYEHMARGSESLMGQQDGGARVPFVPMEQLLAASDDDAPDETVVAEQVAEADDAATLTADTGDTQAAEASPDDAPASAEPAETLADTSTDDAVDEREENSPTGADSDDAFAEEPVDDIRLADAAHEPAADVDDDRGDDDVPERRSA